MGGVCMCVCERVCVYGSVHCTAERKLVLIYWCQAGATSYCCCLKATPAWEFKPRERKREREIVDKCIQIPAVTSWAPFVDVIRLLLFYIPALPMMLWFFPTVDFPCWVTYFRKTLRAKQIHICFWKSILDWSTYRWIAFSFLKTVIGTVLGIISQERWMLRCVAGYSGLVLGPGEDACYPGGH